MGATFLNADLDILSPQPLDPIADAFGDSASCLHCGEDGEDTGYLARFEVDVEQVETPESLAARFCDLAEALGGKPKKLWESASQRLLDLGYEVDADTEPGQGRPIQQELSVSTLQRLGALRMSLVVTIYPPMGDVQDDEE